MNSARRSTWTAVALVLATALSTASASAETITGRLAVVWGDGAPGGDGSSTVALRLVTDDGRSVWLAPSDAVLAAAGGVLRVDRRRVEAVVEADSHLLGSSPEEALPTFALRVLSEPDGALPSRDVVGSHPWVTIACKFSDVASEPRNLAFFQNMYADTWPGLDHYWRTLSYQTANIAGSTAVNWVTLPHPVSHYASEVGGSWDIDLDAMFDDCTAAADGQVYFPDFVGINMMFNATFGPWAWGGGHWASLDGHGGVWRVTWEPPWGYSNITVMCHEMGHGFGLPHSNNADGDTSPYDNPWDVMSDAWSWALTDGTYGTLGKGTISHHLGLLGWIPDDERREITVDGVYEVDLDHLALPTTDAVRVVELPIAGTSRRYTVEVRDRVGYDGGLPGFAVVLHEVDPSRTEPAWLVDPVDPANGGDAGAMWVPGECFEDVPNRIEVCVDHPTAGGFHVTISYGSTTEIFADGFESGATDGWSTVIG